MQKGTLQNNQSLYEKQFRSSFDSWTSYPKVIVFSCLEILIYNLSFPVKKLSMFVLESLLPVGWSEFSPSLAFTSLAKRKLHCILLCFCLFNLNSTILFILLTYTRFPVLLTLSTPTSQAELPTCSWHNFSPHHPVFIWTTHGSRDRASHGHFQEMLWDGTWTSLLGMALRKRRCNLTLWAFYFHIKA